MEIRGTTALVTGSSGGIGRALVEALASQGARLVLAGVRAPADFEPLAASAGGAAVRPVRMDLSSQAAIDASCGELGAQLGEIDILVNNAGRMTGGLLEEQDIGEVYAMFQVNLVAVAHLTHRVLPGMLRRGRGKVVNNASISGYAHFPAASTYAASKAGVVALSESLRRELKGTGVGVLHLVTPGVKTPMLEQTEAVYGRHLDTSGWESVAPEEWAAKTLEAIRDDKSILGPGGKTALAKLASRGPAGVLDALTARAFSRQPRT